MRILENILFLAPHTDDCEFGCGGIISKMVEEGKNIYYAAFSTAEESVPEGYPKNILETEVRNATSKLKIKEENLLIYKYEVRKLNYFRQEILEELVKIKKELHPDVVFIPSSKDIHQDHKTIYEEGCRAFKYSTILGYELPWNNFEFSNRIFFTLSKRHIDQKILALKEYKSQLDKFYATEEFIYSLAKVRGNQVGNDFAESFEVIRIVL